MSWATPLAAEEGATLDRAEQTRGVIAGFQQAYPDADCELKYETALDLVVATILSAQCTDERVNMVTAGLFTRYRTADDYAELPAPQLEDEIHSTGFFRQKTKSILGMARMLLDRFEGQVPRTIEEMVQLPGVARKTANVVLGTAYGIASGVVVDTHVHRLSNRLGLSDQSDPEKIEKDLMQLIPQERWVWFGHAMIWHGRRVCHARQPQCEVCVLNTICPKIGLGASSKPVRPRSRAKLS